MNLIGHGNHWDEALAAQFNLKRLPDRRDVLRQADVVSLHMSLTPETRTFINRETLALMKDGAILINTARGGLVNEADVVEACKSGKLRGYGADVLTIEPIKAPHIFQTVDNILVTPHIGSRTNESVERQGMRAALNLVNFLKGDKDYVQANSW
jgi:D-3-phosphoglycerate dehydrogenase